MEKPEGHVEDAAGAVDPQVYAAIIPTGANEAKIDAAQRRMENDISHERHELSRIAGLIEDTEKELVRLLERWSKDRDSAQSVERQYAKPNETDTLIVALTSMHVRRSKLREEYQMHSDALARAENSHLNNVLPYEKRTGNANDVGVVEESTGSAAGFAP